MQHNAEYVSVPKEALATLIEAADARMSYIGRVWRARCELVSAMISTPAPPQDDGSECIAGDFPHAHKSGPEGCLYNPSDSDGPRAEEG